MAAPRFISELTAVTSLSTAAAVHILQGGFDLRTTAAAFINQAESFTADASGATASDLQSRNRQQRWLWDFLSAAQKSAIAATGTTDCAAAIQAAHDSLPTGGGVVNIGPGGVAIGSTLNFSKPITLRGEGMNNQTLTRLFKLSTLNGNGIYVTSPNVHLENFVFTGQAGNGGNGITVENNHFIARNVHVATMGNDGIRIGKDAGQNSNIWTLENCWLNSNTRYGLYLHDGGANANAGLASRCFFYLNGDDGVRLANANLNTFVGCTSEGNTGYGLNFVSPAKDNVWIGGDIESNTAGQITKAAGATRNMILLPNHSWCIGARVYNVSAISIDHDTVTALTFDTERFDTDDIHSTSSNTGRLTCVTAGKYLITANLGFGSNATGRRFAGIRLDGATYIAADSKPAANGDTTWFSLSTIYDLTATQYVEVLVYQNSTGALNVINFGNASPEFSMIRQN